METELPTLPPLPGGVQNLSSKWRKLFSVSYRSIQTALDERDMYIETIPADADIRDYCCICREEMLSRTYEALALAGVIEAETINDSFGFAIKRRADDRLIGTSILR